MVNKTGSLKYSNDDFVLSRLFADSKIQDKVKIAKFHWDHEQNN